MKTNLLFIPIVFLFITITSSLSQENQDPILSSESSSISTIQEDSKSTPDEGSTPLPEEKKENPLVKKIGEIIAEIEKRFPQFLEPQDEIYVKCIQGLLKQINPEFQYLPEGQDNHQLTQYEPVPFYRPVIIAEQKILYIRIDGFTEENFKPLKEQCLEISRYARQPLGLIIDLRNSQTQNGGVIAAEYASLFTNHSSVHFVENSFREIFKLPMIILISSQTKGDAEIFASILLKAKRSLLVGEKSTGLPFSTYHIKLPSGATLVAPDIPPPLSWIKAEKLIPAIEIPALPQINYDILSGQLGSENSDECIRRVCDLLVSINALEKDKKEAP